MSNSGTPAITGGQAVVATLEHHGVEVVFGIPGEHNIDIYKALGSARIRHVTPRHEQGAGFMADGYARVAGRPGVCLVVTGPGLTNIATPMAQAYTDSIPLLVISGQVQSDWIDTGGGHFHELKDQLGFTASIVDWSARAETVEAIPGLVDRALHALAHEGARGVHLEIPQDVLIDTAVISLPPARVTPAAAPDASQIERAHEILAGAERPVVIVGGGGRYAGEPVMRLAERLDAPVFTTWRGSGAIPLRHPLSVGAGIELQAARDRIAASDVIVIVGSELSQVDFFPTFPEFHGQIVQIDRDEQRIGRRVRIDAPVVGDAAVAAEALLAALGKGPVGSGQGNERATDARDAIEREAAVHAAPYRDVVAGLRSALPPEAILACDLTGPTYWAVPRSFPVEQPNRILMSGIGTLGYSIPGAIGARIAAPEVPVAALVGDGGFMFTATEIMSASEMGQNLVIVVWNNRGFGDIRRQMIESGAQPVGVDLQSPDIVRMAEAFGATGLRLDDAADLPALVDAALERTSPTVIEVVSDR